MNDCAEMKRELHYMQRCAERTAAKILLLDNQSLAMRHELEQKRRGFGLMAELAVTLGQEADFESVFVAVSRRINAALNMQRTVVLIPDADGAFRAVVLQGYPMDEERLIAAQRIEPVPELLDPLSPVLVTGADSPDRLASFREAVGLPFMISSPVILHNEVAAILVTGRLVEQLPFMPRLGRSDVETVQTVSAYLAAMLVGQRLLEAEERTKIMLDATPLCCNFWDEHYNNVDCNEEAARLFGLSGKQEYLDKFNELSPEYQPNGGLSSEMALEKIREAFSLGWVRFEWMHQKPNGEPVPSEITLVRVKRGEGYIVAGYTRDLREQKAMLAEMRKTEDELRLARDLAEKNAKAKSEFLANMSHEIRTPMNAILGMTHLLGGTEMTEKQREYVDKAEHSAHLLLRIINDILDFSKIDAGRMDIESVPFSIRDLIGDVYDSLIEQVKAKGLLFRIHIDSQIPDCLLGDPLRLEQVLLNLAGNAVKFTQAGSIAIRISVDAFASDEIKLAFAVEDTGIGMTPGPIASLFTPFTQADTSTTRKYGGTGLGLAISRSPVALMGGKIWCESRENEGSTFSFSIPFGVSSEDKPCGVKQKAGHLRDEASLPSDKRSGLKGSNDFESLSGMRVLLAEDNEINQMIATELLACKGVVVTAVASGLEVLEAFERDTYELILMDIQMPEMDGLKATTLIRQNPMYENLPIIAMTAHAMTGDREVSLGVGMNDHITKPIDPQLLYETLQRWGKRGNGRNLSIESQS